MDIMELGAIGELVGGLAVFATLVYLAAQVRQSAAQARISSYQTAVVGYASRIERLATDSFYRAIFLSGLVSYDALEPEEQFQFHAIMQTTFSLFQNNLNLFRAGVLPADEFDVYERDVVGILRSPGALSWWQQVGHLEATGLHRYLHHLLDSMPDVPPLTESLPILVATSGSEA